MPPAGRGTRGKLKFQPKSNVRRSKEEREAAEKKEQAALKAEDAAIERERQRAEQRATRGRGRGGARGGRGGLARGGVSGWMNTRGDVGFLSGAMGESSASRGPALPSAGAGTASGEYNSRASGSGGGDARSGGGSTGADGRSSAPVKSDGSIPVRTREPPRRRDGTVMKMINIEHINLISDDEDDEVAGDGATDAERRARRQYRSPRRGLPPVRAAREPHIPRQMRVNIDLDSLSDDDKSKVREVAAELPRETHAKKGAAVDAPNMEVPIKIEQDADVPQPKIEQTQSQPEPDVEVSSTRRSTRSKGKQKVDPKVEQSSTLQPAPEPEPEQEPETQQATEPKKPSASRRALSELQTTKAAATRPDFVRPDCNFISAARPPGWDSKDDTENWERNVQKAYAIYEELSFPDKMKLNAGDGENEAAATTKKQATQDVEMPDPGTATDTKADVQESSSDRKQDLVYLFQLPPGVPSIEGLRTKEDIEKARLASQDSDVMEVTEPPPPASPKTSRAKSPETSRKRKATAAPPSSTSQPKIKKEDEKEQQPRIKTEAEEAGTATTASSGPTLIDGDLPDEDDVRSGKRAPGRERPGYIGDLVVYNTGEVTLDWGGLPLQLKIGQQTNMLQQVLLTSAPVTKAAAVAAEEREEREAKRVVKREKEKEQQTGADAASAMDVDRLPGEGAEGTNASAAAGGAAAARGKTEGDRAFALGSLAGIFTAVPDFRKLFGAKWS